MAKLFITEHPMPSVYQGTTLPVVPMPPLASQTVAIDASSAQSAAFNDKTRIIGVTADAACSIAIGANPTADADSFRLAAGQTIFYEVQPGHKIAVITNT